VVAGPEETRRQILWHTLGMVAATLGLGIAGDTGLVYMVSAIVLGAIFIYYAVALWRSPTPRVSMNLFRFSILYLAALFAAILVDTLVAA
jgi:protoheme IX farnesyltransferase